MHRIFAKLMSGAGRFPTAITLTAAFVALSGSRSALVAHVNAHRIEVQKVLTAGNLEAVDSIMAPPEARDVAAADADDGNGGSPSTGTYTTIESVTTFTSETGGGTNGTCTSEVLVTSFCGNNLAAETKGTQEVSACDSHTSLFDRLRSGALRATKYAL